LGVLYFLLSHNSYYRNIEFRLFINTVINPAFTGIPGVGTGILPKGRIHNST